MTTAVIGATGRVGSQIVRGVLARGDPVAALVRDAGKARRAFGEPDGLHIRPTRLDDPSDLTAALDGIRAVFIAMGSTGIEGVLQRIAINAAARISSIEQVTRLSVLNTSEDSLGINQRAHYSIDQFAASTAVQYSTIRPAIFSASLLAAAPEVRASRTWTGLAGSGRMALIDHRDVAEAGLRVLTDPALWGAHHDLTGPVPMSWPEVLELLSAELAVLGANRGVEARQQTLEAAIGWSYGLLGERERLLWARLSVFAGGCEEDAVIQVCADQRLPAGQIAGLLGALVEKSILKRQLKDGSPPRYWLLDTLRQYGQQRLRELGEEPAAQKRHLEWICALAKMIGVWDGRQAELFQRMSGEQDNLWAALDFCQHQPAGVAAGAQLARNLLAYWQCRGPYGDVRRILTALAGPAPENSLSRARLLLVAAAVATR